ncbi:Uncharacterised protein [Mycobacteroides abscessus subsp. abscessus]|nr:Uncharacterised protein [Mycobacteroides abscessus subsp. abscessus]
MPACHIAEWPQRTKLHKDGSLWMPPYSHARLEKDVRSGLWSRNPFRIVVAVRVLGAEVRDVVRGKQDHHSLRQLEGRVERLADVGTR